MPSLDFAIDSCTVPFLSNFDSWVDESSFSDSRIFLRVALIVLIDIFGYFCVFILKIIRIDYFRLKRYKSLFVAFFMSNTMSCISRSPDASHSLQTPSRNSLKLEK